MNFTRYLYKIAHCYVLFQHTKYVEWLVCMHVKTAHKLCAKLAHKMCANLILDTGKTVQYFFLFI